MYFALFACVFSPSPCEPSQHNTHKGRTDYDFCSRPPHFPSIPTRRQLLRKKERKKEKTIRLLSSEPRAGKTSSKKKKDNSRSSCSSSPFPSPLRHSPRTQQLYTYREYKRHGTARDCTRFFISHFARTRYPHFSLFSNPSISGKGREWEGETSAADADAPGERHL